MATCPKCQTFNREDGAVCVTCGQALSTGRFGMRGLLKNLVKDISMPFEMPEWFLKMACKFELHGGEYAYIDSGRCNEVRVCWGCGVQTIRVRHDVAYWKRDESVFSKKRPVFVFVATSNKPVTFGVPMTLK